MSFQYPPQPLAQQQYHQLKRLSGPPLTAKTTPSSTPTSRSTSKGILKNLKEKEKEMAVSTRALEDEEKTQVTCATYGTGSSVGTGMTPLSTSVSSITTTPSASSITTTPTSSSKSIVDWKNISDLSLNYSMSSSLALSSSTIRSILEDDDDDDNTSTSSGSSSSGSSNSSSEEEGDEHESVDELMAQVEAQEARIHEKVQEHHQKQQHDQGEEEIINGGNSRKRREVDKQHPQPHQEEAEEVTLLRNRNRNGSTITRRSTTTSASTSTDSATSGTSGSSSSSSTSLHSSARNSAARALLITKTMRNSKTTTSSTTATSTSRRRSRTSSRNKSTIQDNDNDNDDADADADDSTHKRNRPSVVQFSVPAADRKTNKRKKNKEKSSSSNRNKQNEDQQQQQVIMVMKQGELQECEQLEDVDLEEGSSITDEPTETSETASCGSSSNRRVHFHNEIEQQQEGRRNSLRDNSFSSTLEALLEEQEQEEAEAADADYHYRFDPDGESSSSRGLESRSLSTGMSSRIPRLIHQLLQQYNREAQQQQDALLEDDDEDNITKILSTNWCRALLILLLIGLIGIMIGFIAMLVTGRLESSLNNNNSSSNGPYNNDNGANNKIPSLEEEEEHHHHHGTTTTTITEPQELPSSQKPFEFRLYDILPSYTLYKILDDPTSPQARAYDWILNYPQQQQHHFLLPNWRIRQLFALVTYFFSFGGDTWPNPSHKLHWLSYNVSECYWGRNTIDDNDNAAETTAAKTIVNRNSDNNNNDKLDMYEELLVSSSTIGLTAWCYDNGTIRHLIMDRVLLLNDEDEEEFNDSIIINDNHYYKMPPEMEFLTSLQSLEMMNSGFHTNATTVQLEDLLPTQLKALTSLRRLSFQSNNIVGTIPTRLFDTILTQTPLFEYLSLGNNQLTGTIPSQVGELSNTNLQELLLYGNELSGQIPSQLGTIQQLTGLSLLHNDLSGTIPTQLSNNLHLEWLDVDRNDDLIGQIPKEICQLPSLKEVIVDCSVVDCGGGGAPHHSSECEDVCKCRS